MEKYIPSELALAGFSPKPVGGILYLAKGKRYEALIRFKKVGEHQWDPTLVQGTVDKFKLNQDKLKTMVQSAALAAAEDE